MTTNTEDNECITLSSTLQDKQPVAPTEQSRLTANEAVTNQTGLTSAAINGILHKRLKRAVKERMVNIKLVKDLRDNGMRISATQFDKYTVVELEFMGCHYHGFTSCNPEDTPNRMEAVGRALTRALNELFAKNRFGDLKRVRILDDSGVIPVSPGMFKAMVRGTD